MYLLWFLLYLQLRQLPVKVRVFLKSPPRSPHQTESNKAPTAAKGLAAAADGTSRAKRPIPSDVIPGVVQRVHLTHQRSLEKEEEMIKIKNGGAPRSETPSRPQGDKSNGSIETTGRPRTRSFSLKTEKKRVGSTSSESEASNTTPTAATSKVLSPITHRSTRTMSTDPTVGLNIIKETTILQDGDEPDAPMAQLDELKQFYSFEGILEIKYTTISRTVAGEISEPTSPVVPYKYTRTTVTKSRSCSPSVSRAGSRSTSPRPSRPVTPTSSVCTQTSIDEDPCVATHETPTRLAVPRGFYYSELDSDSDTMMDTTDTGDSSEISTPDEQHVEYVRLISPDDDEDDDYYDEDDEINASFQSLNTSYDSLEIPHQQFDSARSMSESSSLTSVTMLPSPVSWSVPLREVDISEDVLSPADTVDDMANLPEMAMDSPVTSPQAFNIHSAMQDLKLDSDNDSGVDHGEVRSDSSVVIEEQLTRKVQGELYAESPCLGATPTVTEHREQAATQSHRTLQEQPQDKVATKRKDFKDSKKPKDGKKSAVSVRKNVPPFTSDHIPFTASAGGWPFRIRPASMMFQFNRRYVGQSGQGNALMMLFGPLIYNPSFPWHDALVTLKVPRHVLKDMNAHLAIAQLQHQNKKGAKRIRVLDSGAKDPSIDDDEEGSDVDAGGNIEALMVVEVQDPEEVEESQQQRRKERSKDPKDKSSAPPKEEHCFTTRPPKKDDKECVIL